jgi:hypothetical protein
MLLFHARAIATLGFPQPAIVTPVTLAVPPDLLRLTRIVPHGLGAYGTQFIFSNGVTANNLLKNIDGEVKKIDSWQTAIRAQEARQGVTRYRRTAQYRNYTRYINEANDRIANYKRQLARLVVYVNPVFPISTVVRPTFPQFPPLRSPYFDNLGRPLFDATGRPYFDQYGRPYPYTPFYYYR